MKLSVIMPAYNEAKTIKAVLEKLVALKEVDEVVVVDDASQDNTAGIVKTVKSKKVVLVQHKKNQGKGKAIRTAISHLKGDYAIIQDADLEYDPQEIPQLLKPVINGRAEVVYGSRFLGARTNMFYWHYVGNKTINFMVNILYNSILSDLETCYKLLPTKLWKELDLQQNDFRIEVEITCKLLARHIPILEMPISYVGRTYEDGKKITWVDGVKAISTIARYRLGGF